MTKRDVASRSTDTNRLVGLRVAMRHSSLCHHHLLRRVSTRKPYKKVSTLCNVGTKMAGLSAMTLPCVEGSYALSRDKSGQASATPLYTKRRPERCTRLATDCSMEW
jgi:hypothetical protein